MKLDKEMIIKYLMYCEKGKDLSKHTLKAYRIDLRQFHDFIGKYNDDIDKNILCEYIYHLHHTFKAKTIKRKHASVHSFLHYLKCDGVLLTNPLEELQLKVKVDRMLPKVIERENLSTLYREMYNESIPNKRMNIRNIAIIETLLSTGIRVSELCALKIKDVNLKEQYIRVFGKGRKERVIFLGNENVVGILEKYKQSHLIDKRLNDTFFINQWGLGISDQSVRNIIKKYVKQSGLYINITPHMFRHTFATMLLEEDVDIRYIQNILGHSSITTTQIYTHISTNKQKEILFSKNPRNFIHI